MKYAISIDIGGTNTRVALVNSEYRIVERVAFPTDGDDPHKTISKINESIESFGKEVSAMGVSCPGPMDLKKGVILTPPNLPGWHQFHLVEALQKATGLKTYLENDANLAGLAEASIGAGKDFNPVQYLTVSTGLGGGFVLDGEIYQGPHGFAQEIANVILEPNGFKLNDLKPGSLESLCSGTGIVAQAKAYGIEAEHAGIVNDLALAGNEDAKAVMEKAKQSLAQAIASIYAFLDPDVVVLGGSVALKIDGFIEDVESRVKELVFDVVKDHVRLVPAQLGDDNGLIGGAILAFNKSE